MATNQPDPVIGIQYELRQLATATVELATRIDTLTHVVTDGFAEIRDGFAEIRDGFAELKHITQQQANTAASQAKSVTRLIALLERK
jgi:methyl-accepting chemotaxis protein